MIVMGAHASIRHARVEDAEAIAAVHVAAWRESYTGLVPAEMLASLSVDERADRWRRILVPLHSGFDRLSVSRIEHGQVGVVHLDSDAPSRAGLA